MELDEMTPADWADYNAWAEEAFPDPLNAAGLQIRKLTEQRDKWIRLFNRLEGAVSHHRSGKSDLFADEVDEALWAASHRVLRDALGEEIL